MKIDTLARHGILGEIKLRLGAKRNPNGTFIANDPAFEKIKIRLYDKDRNTLHIYTLSKLINTTFRKGSFEFRGRWTGLHDKNGKEIYEGDILFAPAPGKNDIQVVKWDINMFTVPRISWTWKVIGNIYDNPELLTYNSDSGEKR